MELLLLMCAEFYLLCSLFEYQNVNIDLQLFYFYLSAFYSLYHLWPEILHKNTRMLFWCCTKWSLWLHFVESCYISNLPFNMMNVSMTESKWALPAIDPHCLQLLCTLGGDIGSTSGKFLFCFNHIVYIPGVIPVMKCKCISLLD